MQAGKEAETFKISSHRMHKGLHMLKFEGINNINDIEYLKGATLLQERDHSLTTSAIYGIRYSLLPLTTQTSLAPVSNISVTRPIAVPSSSNTVQPIISE